MRTKIIFKSFALIGLLSSSTLIAQNTWTKHPTPVLSRSAVFPNWKGLGTGDAFVMNDNDTLKMWYSGVGWLTGSDTCPHVRIGYAWSLDGINWNEHASNPVLDISSDTSKFDSDGVETPTVIKDISAPASERYKLWYAGRKTKCSSVNDHKFGYAYSPDGISWSKYTGNPVLIPGSSSSWYNTFISGPSVILESGIYKMWFTAPDLVINSQPTDGKGNIGYATSTNGINWTVHPSAVLIAGDQSNWDSASIGEPSVIKVGTTFHMFYSALDQWTIENFQVGYATSTDGINWIKSTQNPVLQIGTVGQWDRYWASHPAVIYDSINNKFKMWYTGRDTATIVSLTGYYWDIGYAVSNFALGINEANHDEKLVAIYPNPVQNNLNIQLSIDLKNATLTIYNSLGQIEKYISNLNGRNINIETLHLSNGVYFVVLQNGDRQLNNKFIIQK
jgi:hypothetical protein